MSNRLVGILGGCGPAATVHFQRRLVERTDARCDQDHVRTLAFNDSAVPDRTAFLLGESARSPAAALIEDGRLLEACGCEVLALPCNTAHCFFDEVQAALAVPVIHMVSETMGVLAEAGTVRAGVLATAGTIAADLYGREGARRSIACVYPAPSVQRRVDHLIYEEVKAGRGADSSILDDLARPLAEDGCEAVVLGCTELSLAFAGRARAAGLPVIDPLDVLARRTIEYAGYAPRPAAAGIAG